MRKPNLSYINFTVFDRDVNFSEIQTRYVRHFNTAEVKTIDSQGFIKKIFGRTTAMVLYSQCTVQRRWKIQSTVVTFSDSHEQTVRCPCRIRTERGLNLVVLLLLVLLFDTCILLFRCNSYII